MPNTYDSTVDTPRNRVRLLVNDVDVDTFHFHDEEIDRLLDMEGDDVKLAAATALDVIASNEAEVQKRIKLLELTTDGPAVAKSLREHAVALRSSVDDGADFEIAEMVFDEFSARERLVKEQMRRA